VLSRYDEFLRQCSPYFLTVRKPEEPRPVEDLTLLVRKCIDNENKRQKQAEARNKRRKG
jgi:hypothetical protein